MDQVNVMTVETARKVLSAVDQGLRPGPGEPIPGKMGIDAAVCYALGLPRYCVDPRCVDPALWMFVCALSDSDWSSPQARAKGMRKLAVAQLGSLGKLDSIKFAQRLAEQTIRRLLPPILRQIELNDAADRCEQEGTEAAAYAAANAALAARAERLDGPAAFDNAALAAANAATNAADAINAANSAAFSDFAAVRCSAFTVYTTRCSAYATRCTAYAANAAANATVVADAAASDSVLTLMGDICIDILREMKAPGIALMDQVC